MSGGRRAGTGLCGSGSCGRGGTRRCEGASTGAIGCAGILENGVVETRQRIAALRLGSIPVPVVVFEKLLECRIENRGVRGAAVVNVCGQIRIRDRVQVRAAFFCIGAICRPDCAGSQGWRRLDWECQAG